MCHDCNKPNVCANKAATDCSCSEIKCDGGFKTTDRFVNTTDQELRWKEQRIQRIQEKRKQGEVHPLHEIGVISDTTTRSNEKGPRVHEEQRKAERKKMYASDIYSTPSPLCKLQLFKTCVK